MQVGDRGSEPPSSCCVSTARISSGSAFHMPQCACSSTALAAPACRHASTSQPFSSAAPMSPKPEYQKLRRYSAETAGAALTARSSEISPSEERGNRHATDHPAGERGYVPESGTSAFGNRVLAFNTREGGKGAFSRLIIDGVAFVVVHRTECCPLKPRFARAHAVQGASAN